MSLHTQLDQMKKGNYEPVYLVQGAEHYLQQMVRDYVLKQIVDVEDRELNVGVYNMENELLQHALADAESLPFFGERRVVIIERPYFLTAEKDKAKLEHDVAWLEQYVAQPTTSTIFVIFAPYEKLDARKKIVKLLQKQATVIDTKRLKEKEMAHYIRQAIEQADYTIEKDAFDELIVKTNAQLSYAMRELEKLLIATVDTKYITLQHVEQLVAKSLEQTIFELVEKILQKNSEQALAIFHDLLLQKEEPIKMNAILLGQLRLFLQVAYLMRQGYAEVDIQKTLAIHPYRIKLAMQQVRKFSLATLEQAYVMLVNTEWQMKTGQGSKEIQFELFILKFCA